MTGNMDILQYHPLQKQKEAQQLVKDHNGLINAPKIKFTLLVGSNGQIAQCIWTDPYLGLFQFEGIEDKGCSMIKELPEGSLIINQWTD